MDPVTIAIYFSIFHLQILIFLHHTTIYAASSVMANILFTRFFNIICNVFPSHIYIYIYTYVHTMIQILRSSKPVLDFFVTLLSNLQFGIGLILSFLDFPSANYSFKNNFISYTFVTVFIVYSCSWNCGPLLILFYVESFII